MKIHITFVDVSGAELPEYLRSLARIAEDKNFETLIGAGFGKSADKFPIKDRETIVGAMKLSPQ